LDERFILGRKSMNSEPSVPACWTRLSNLTLFVLLLVSCSGRSVPEPQPTPSGMDKEEYKVISAVLRQWEDFLMKGNPGLKRERYYFTYDTVAAKRRYDSLTQSYGDLTYYFVLEDRTVQASMKRRNTDWGDGGSGISEELLRSFDSVNAKPCALERKYFTDSIVVELIPGPTTSVPEVPWKSLHFTAEPNALTQSVTCVSRVGFNKHRTAALVYWESWSGSMAAGGKYFLLAKKKNAWKMVGIAKAWSSM
jgi:hypothetical protein